MSAYYLNAHILFVPLQFYHIASALSNPLSFYFLGTWLILKLVMIENLLFVILLNHMILSITSSSRPGGICAVSTLINIYEKYGFHTLDRVLRLCVATWEGAPMSFSSNMLNAIARLDNAYGETMKDDTFKEKVGRVSVREISRSARERRAGSLGFAEALLLDTIKNPSIHFLLRNYTLIKHPKKENNQLKMNPVKVPLQKVS